MVGWVDEGRRWEGVLVERAVVNENPVFLRVLWLVLAVVQSAVHLGRGEDRIKMDEKREGTTTDRAKRQEQNSAYQIPESLQELGGKAPTILGQTMRLLIPSIALTLPLYLLLIRHIIWPYYHALASLFFSRLPETSRPTGLQHHLQLSWQALSSSLMLLVLWELSNTIFTIFISRPPLRRDLPLTAEVKDARGGNVVSRSKDPNGSLIMGLKSKREVLRGFAFWELAIICEAFEGRRKTIYTEVDRKEGSTWTQVSQCCLDEIEAIRTRIKAAQAPPPPPPPSAAQPQQTAQQQPLGLPKIASRPTVQNADILTKPISTDLTHSVGSAAKSIGQNANAAHTVQVRARQALEWSADRVLTKEEQQRLSKQGLEKEANSIVVKFLSSAVGVGFRQGFSRRVERVVLGGGAAAAGVKRENGEERSRRTEIVFASQALSILCVRSLQEDDYGQVARSVPLILRTYTGVINAVVEFVGSATPHWTDVDFAEGKNASRRVREVEEVLDVLKAGLEGVVLAFGEYAEAVGVTKKELREAREAVGRGLEMMER